MLNKIRHKLSSRLSVLDLVSHQPRSIATALHDRVILGDCILSILRRELLPNSFNNAIIVPTLLVSLGIQMDWARRSWSLTQCEPAQDLS